MKLVYNAPILKQEIHPGRAFLFLIHRKIGNWADVILLDLSVERTHSQIRNPAWVSLPVPTYRKKRIRDWLYTELSVKHTHAQIRNPSWTSFPVSYLQIYKKLVSHNTEFSVERTHSQIRNPAWVSLPVPIYRRIRNSGLVIY